MAAINIALTAALNLITAGNGPMFSEWGLITFLASVAVFLFGVALLAKPAGTVSLTRALADLLGILSVRLLLTIALFGLWIVLRPSLAEHRQFAVYGWQALNLAVTAWTIVALIRAGGSLWPHSVRTGGLRMVAAAGLTVLLVPANVIFEGPDTDWTRRDVWAFAQQLFDAGAQDDNSEQASPVDYEAAIYQQASMVERSVSSLEPASGNRSEFYFVGFAPSAAQTVFKSEILGARDVFAGRLGRRTRSLVMVNNAGTLSDYPMASATNLDMTLAALGRTMRPERDILTLFITSHGGPGRLSVYFPGFTLNQITPDGLAEALRRSGIRNRIIIISACYSGSFLSALSDDNAIVMTAASAKKTSFGCSNEREWTYFGDAFFNHALRQTTSIPAAFDIARDLIATWEKEQNLTPSDPQISVGRNIASLLEVLAESAPPAATADSNVLRGLIDASAAGPSAGAAARSGVRGS